MKSAILRSLFCAVLGAAFTLAPLSTMAETPLEKGERFLAENKTEEGVRTTASGLQYKITREGTGKSPKASDTVKVRYRGTLIDGREFDRSNKRNADIASARKALPVLTEKLAFQKEKRARLIQMVGEGQIGNMEASTAMNLIVSEMGRLEREISLANDQIEDGVEFPLNRVIPGWTEGLQLLKEGGQAILYVPAKLAYGERGTPGGPIGPNETLIFDIELLKVK